ncbi:unnamed protein product, partial [Prorocentrum cordatum]
ARHAGLGPGGLRPARGAAPEAAVLRASAEAIDGFVPGDPAMPWAAVGPEDMRDVLEATRKRLAAARERASHRADDATHRAHRAQDALEGEIPGFSPVVDSAKQEASGEKSRILESPLIGDSLEVTPNLLKAASDLGAAQEGLDAAARAQAQVEAQVAAAKEAEEAWLRNTAGGRSCVDLPGVRLRSQGPENEFRRVMDPAWYPELNSSQACADWCRQHAACAEATFSRVGVPEGGEQCRLFEARGELYDFRDDFNASWCGALEEVDHLLWEVKKLFEQKPWVGDNYGAHPCSFGGDDCSQTRCCGTQTCDWSFTSCEYFQCVRKDEYYAGCTDAPEAGWDGEVLGGGPNEDDLPRAEEGKLVHPGSLFCFTVVMPGERSSAGVSESESALVETARETKSGIYSCDDQMVVDGWEDGGGSEANIDVFISYWKKVQNDGRYLLHDWLIKADADCVFVADRVKARFEIFRPPAGAAVYFRNTEFKFNFMGAFEMMSREGAQVFFAGAWQCDGKMDHKGGEDYWMRLCLDTLGLRYIADPSLLYDKYAAQNGCADERAAAFHFYKTPETYRECLAEISR